MEGAEGLRSEEKMMEDRWKGADSRVPQDHFDSWDGNVQD